jgi:hypothetical protein
MKDKQQSGAGQYLPINNQVLVSIFQLPEHIRDCAEF